MGTAIKISTGLPVLEDLAWMETTNLTPEELNSRVINKGIIPALREMGHDVKTDRFSAEGGEFYILDTEQPFFTCKQQLAMVRALCSRANT